jgi:hypothetical protein
MKEMVMCNAGVVLSPIYPYAMHNAGWFLPQKMCNAGQKTPKLSLIMRKHYLLIILNSRELIALFFAIFPCPYICKGNLTDLRRILHLSLAKGNPK